MCIGWCLHDLRDVEVTWWTGNGCFTVILYDLLLGRAYFHDIITQHCIFDRSSFEWPPPFSTILQYKKTSFQNACFLHFLQKFLRTKLFKWFHYIARLNLLSRKIHNSKIFHSKFHGNYRNTFVISSKHFIYICNIISRIESLELLATQRRLEKAFAIIISNFPYRNLPPSAIIATRAMYERYTEQKATIGWGEVGKVCERDCKSACNL